MNWYVIYIKPKCEESTVLQLRNAGIEALNPKIRTKKYIRGKYVNIIEPLFPSYIFAYFDTENHGHMIRYTRGVKFIVGKQNPLVVPQEIIDTILERMEGDIVVPVSEKLKSGDRVLIKEGPFANCYGIFERDVPNTYCYRLFAIIGSPLNLNFDTLSPPLFYRMSKSLFLSATYASVSLRNTLLQGLKND